MKYKIFSIAIFFVAILLLSGCTINIGAPSNQNQVDNDKSEVVDEQDDQETASEDQTSEVELEPCGDNTCDVGEESICCTDCGCEEGFYCSEDDTCQEVMVFKPMPAVAVELFKDEKKVSPLLPMGTIKFVPFIANQEPIIISDEDLGGVGRPSIYGNKITFHQFESSNPRAYMYDTITKETSKIPYDGRLYNPNIGANNEGGFIVWTDYDRGFADNSDIYYYNFSINEEGYISPRHDYQDDPKAYGNAIVWDEQRSNGGRALYLFWIPGSEEIKIFADSKRDIYDYEIWGGSVVFATRDCSNATACDYKLHHYDIAERKQTVILNPDVGIKIHSVSIWDKQIAYIAGNSSQSVYIYNLETKLTKKIAELKSKEEYIGTAIYQNKVVWSDETDDNFEIFLYDLDAKEEKRLTNNNKDDTHPDIYDKYVVYQHGNMDIELQIIE